MTNTIRALVALLMTGGCASSGVAQQAASGEQRPAPAANEGGAATSAPRPTRPHQSAGIPPDQPTIQPGRLW